jgi:hypothetical protein
VLHGSIEDRGEFAVFDVLGGELLDETTRAATLRAAVFDASAAPGEREGFLRAGNADVEETPLFVNGPFQLRAIVREDAILKSEEINVRELEPLGGM